MVNSRAVTTLKIKTMKIAQIVVHIDFFYQFTVPVLFKKENFFISIEYNNRKMLKNYRPQQSDPSYSISLLQIKNEQLVRDNFALSREVFRLRQMIDYYEQKIIQFKRVQECQKAELIQLKNNNKNILERIDKSDGHTTMQITNKIKQLKKQVFYKRTEQLESKYQKKNQQCEQLLLFKDKLQRLRNSWDLKSKDKPDSNSTQSLFIWIYNQIVKAKGSSQRETPKNSKHKFDENKSSKRGKVMDITPQVGKLTQSHSSKTLLENSTINKVGQEKI